MTRRISSDCMHMSAALPTMSCVVTGTIPYPSRVSHRSGFLMPNIVISA